MKFPSLPENTHKNREKTEPRSNAPEICISSASLNWWGKSEYPQETTDRTVASHRQTLSHKIVSSTPHHKRDSNSRS